MNGKEEAKCQNVREECTPRISAAPPYQPTGSLILGGAWKRSSPPFPRRSRTSLGHVIFALPIDTGKGLSSCLFLSKKVTLEVNVNRVRGFYFFCFSYILFPF